MFVLYGEDTVGKWSLRVGADVGILRQHAEAEQTEAQAKYGYYPCTHTISWEWGEESVLLEELRYGVWKAHAAPPPLTPLHDFALALLRGDPVAVDACTEVLCGAKIATGVSPTSA